MRNRPAENPDDAEGWPDDAEAAEVARFARRLRAARPELSGDALARVGAALRQRLGADAPGAAAPPSSRPRRFRLAAWAALLGALAAAAAWWLSPPAGAPPTLRAGPAPAPLVRDRYTIPSAGTPAPQAPEQPLLRLDEYKDLFPGDAPGPEN